MERSSNKTYSPLGNFIYHFVAGSVRVHWNSLKRIESSCKELEEHQRWKVVTCSLGSSLDFPSKLGMSEGSLLKTIVQAESWDTRSFISLDKSGRFNVVRKGSLGWAGLCTLPGNSGSCKFDCCKYHGHGHNNLLSFDPWRDAWKYCDAGCLNYVVLQRHNWKSK